MTKNAIQVRPIRTEEDHDAAVARIAELMGSPPGTLAGDELDVLATLVDAWEAKNHPIDPPDPLMAIQFRMEQQGLTRSDLEPMIGSRARVSEVLTGKRKLTIEMIRRVRLGLGISADSLIESAPSPRNSQSKRRKSSRSPRRINALRPSARSSARRSATG
jgi:HTH-type transcriptional regulator / antitoxin HigA